MAELTLDTVFYPRLLALRECLCSVIKERELPDVCFCGLVPGAAVPLDYAGACSNGRSGMAWVRLTGLFPAPIFVEGSGGFTPCGTPLIASVEVGIARPAPVFDARGNPPSYEAQQESAAWVMADMAAAQYAITCCFPAHLREVRLSAWTPIGPEGGVVGGFWTVDVTDE